MNNEIENKEEVVLETKKTEETAQPMRQILIETDGNEVKLTKTEVAGKIELVAILQSIINFLNNQK